MTSGDLIGTWIGAILTLFIFSFLYKDNPFFRFAESLFAGISLGYYIGIVSVQTLKPNLVIPLFTDFTGNWHLVIPLLLGIALYTRYIGKIAWIARIPLSVYVGYYVGINMVQKLQGEVVPQIGSTMMQLIPGNGVGVTAALNNVVIFAGVLSVLIYFFFSMEHKGLVGGVSRLGIWFLMLGFGAAFGYTVMGRISLLIGRIYYLWSDWILGTIATLGGGS
ncbi:MAG: hypothetical protein KJ970_03585 [Candidatus Eisenbacteria bacterium]|uniref:Uncharacterized protein n=1 Tax=Eiseniibacteriota bacterium TaxID=2212470 RepID=A0A948RUU9_UNCEI|nr:hypothetical protein [Candidatus Eisenbacteria bacterium]MBU1948812.1 hypothetical protein [Candidatus Eisenbacteria bacterium]MBU2689983.1 hypothetical protein [Candidatus Eisenbacteria bacterium]